MKKLIFLFAFCIVVTNVFAQTAPEQLKKEGNDAFNAKNYPVAYAKLYVATLEEGLKVDPKNKTMVKNYGLHYLKAGLAAQKAGKAEEAEDCFKKVIPLDHKQYKTNALYSLGVLCYNDGANILKKAAPLANSDADKYAAEKEKADGRFKEALDYLEEAAKISPENENVKKMLPQVKAVMK